LLRNEENGENVVVRLLPIVWAHANAARHRENLPGRALSEFSQEVGCWIFRQRNEWLLKEISAPNKKERFLYFPSVSSIEEGVRMKIHNNAPEASALSIGPQALPFSC
jgi:hypothetical protein